MKLLYTILLTIICTASIMAQPSAVKKAGKSIVKLNTFKDDGSLLSSGYGVFTDASGIVLTAWQPFIGARSAVLFDSQGNKYDVECILGANSYYNVARLRIKATGKMNITPAIMEQTSQPVGAESWCGIYGGKNTTWRKLPITKCESFMTDLPYYIMEQQENPLLDDAQGSPCFNAQGQLMGLLNTSSSRTDLYFASARFTSTLQPAALSVNDITLRSTNVRLALPDDYNQALLAIVMMAQRDSTNYSASLDDFIRMFPDKEDGYINKAEWLASTRDFAGADGMMTQAIEKAEKKDDAHFKFSRLIYNKETLMADAPYEQWNLDKAIAEINAAIAINDVSIYRIQKGKILFSQKKYGEAFTEFDNINKNGANDAEVYYYAYQSLKNSDADKAQQLIQLDSAICVAPKILLYQAERTLLLLKMKRYEDAAAGATQLITIAPDYAEGHGLLGLALCMGGNRQRGVAELQRAKAMGYEQAEGFLKTYGRE